MVFSLRVAAGVAKALAARALRTTSLFSSKMSSREGAAQVVLHRVHVSTSYLVEIDPGQALVGGLCRAVDFPAPMPMRNSFFMRTTRNRAPSRDHTCK